MSIKSTHDVTRAFALAAIERKLPQANEEQLHNIWRILGYSAHDTLNFSKTEFKYGILEKINFQPDWRLAKILEEVIHDGFMNFTIVSEEDFEANKTAEWPSPYLENLNYLPEYNNAQ